MRWIASAAFGLEGLVKKELSQLGIKGMPTLGGVAFEGDADAAFLANLHVRTADRVRLVLQEGRAESFDMLFELVRAIPWEDCLARNAAFPVSATCARSRLMSVRDCQAIAKKAIVERLRSGYSCQQLPETGTRHAIGISIHQDRVRVTMDASGDALSRRGYRTWTGEAPLRETLAAAMLLLSPWDRKQPLYDPLCGTATILIEAAFLRAGRAPGLTRPFAMESWSFLNRSHFAHLRQDAQDRFDPRLVRDIAGSDIDPEALDLARRHLIQAGLEGLIHLEQRDFRQLELQAPAPCIVTNPPYGERLGDQKTAEAHIRALGELARRTPGSSITAISSHPGFERFFGRRAAAKRRLYNGRLECEVLVFPSVSTGASASSKSGSAGGSRSQTISSASSRLSS